MSALTHQHFEGRWVGETMGCASPAHLWHLRVQGMWILVETVWEGHAQVGRPSQCKLLAGEPAFEIDTELHHFKAVLVDPQHFIIKGWDTNDMRGYEGPDFDVVFSRPGIAELNAEQVWLDWKKRQD